jgi:hypothetical protein
MVVETSDGIRIGKFPLKTVNGEPVFDESEVVYLHEYACVPCSSNIDYNKLQKLFYYVAEKTEANCTKEYKERILCLFVPYDDNGILRFECSKCSAFRFLKTQEWLDEFVSKYPDLLLKAKLLPLEQLELSSLFIVNKEYYNPLPKFV